MASVSLTPSLGGWVPLWDKSLHATFYAIYVLLGCELVHTPRHFYQLCAAIFIYSGLMEIGQHYVPGRSMSGLDLLANGIGISLGMVLAIRALPALKK